MSIRKLLTCTISVTVWCASAVAAPPGIVTPFDEGSLLPSANVEPESSVLRGFGPGFQVGADHIINFQCVDGGWGWPHTACPTTTFNNITGPIALGLLHAHSYTGDPDHIAAAIAGGDFDLTFAYPNTESRFGAFAPYFLLQLGGAYATHAETGFFDELTAKTYGPSDLDTHTWIAAVQAGRSGSLINLRPWDLHLLPAAAGALGNADSTTPLDGITQQDAFRDAVLDGLNTLDQDINPASDFGDVIGLAGGVRGLALNSSTTFAAIVSPNHPDINGINDLCDLADVLAGYQNSDGSWYWFSDPGETKTESDKDVQTSAYVILALVATEGEGCGPYTTQIDKGRDWIRSMQLPDGGFASYPGGAENIEVEGEALNALAPDTCTDNVLSFLPVAGSECVQPGETIQIELHQLNLTGDVRGFQAFAQFDSSVMSHVSNVFTSSPFGLPILNVVSGDEIDLAAGIDDGGGQLPTDDDALLVTLSFTAGQEGPTVVSFRPHFPQPSRFTDPVGQEVTPCLVESPTIYIDGTDPVITCPADAVVECDESTDPSNTGEATATDNLDDNPLVEFSDVEDLDDCDGTGTITRTWTATDCAGNSTSCEQIITVQDTTPPLIACPADVTVECDESTAPANTGVPTFAQGFETGRDGWLDFDGALTRVPSGAGGVTSYEGNWHAEVTGAFTRWGGYQNTFPAGGYTTSVKIYLDTALGLADNTRMDYSSAINNPSGNHRRDFIFHAGFYSSSDVTGPGAGTDRFIFNASNNSPGFPKNPAGSPTHSTTTGWYTVEHVFYDSGGGVLAVDVNVYDPSDVLVYSRTLSDPSDIIGGTVGGNRYGWFLNMGWTLPVDLTVISTGLSIALDNCDASPTVTFSDVDSTGACPQEKTITRTWQAEDACGNIATCEQVITVEDSTAPVFEFVPPDVTIECSDSLVPSGLYGVATGGVAVYYNSNGGGENPANQAFLKAQIDGTNDPSGGVAGAPFVYSNAPLVGGNPFSWQSLYSGLIWPESQYGLDFVLQAPTNDGSVPTPTLNAYNNGNNDVSGRALVGPVTWAVNDYKPHMPDISAGDVLNSIVRSQSPGMPAVDIEITQLELSQAGPIYTLDIAGKLVSTGIHYWYGIGQPDSPMAEFGLNGDLFFFGTLTYDSTGDTGTDLINFYEGTIEVYANSPTTQLEFARATDNCDPIPTVTFVDDLSGLTGCNGTGTILRTWTATDACGNSTDVVQTITVEDTTAPVLSDCPDDITVPADAGGCDAVVTYAEPTATDNCDGAPAVVCDWPSGSVFPQGTTAVTCTATDGCGNTSSCGFSVTVENVNELSVTVELQPNIAPTGTLTRCITFELWECGGPSSVEVSAEIDFDVTFVGPANTAIGTAVIEVPCGNYTCITARDKLHTLRRTDETFGISGTQYVADFTGDPGSGGDWLIGGNLNDDTYIDILDFGVFSFQFGSSLGADTTCATAAPHSDISGDGNVTNLDFSFVLNNFLEEHEANCCGAPLRATAGGNDGPVTSITLAELRRRGLLHLSAGDLNNDRVLDIQDVAAFLDGARPKPNRVGPAELTPGEANAHLAE